MAVVKQDWDDQLLEPQDMQDHRHKSTATLACNRTFEHEVTRRTAGRGSTAASYTGKKRFSTLGEVNELAEVSSEEHQFGSNFEQIQMDMAEFTSVVAQVLLVCVSVW